MNNHEKNQERKIISGFSWNFAERILAQGTSFVVSVILARILTPGDYGVVSLVLIFINIANVFVSDGFGESLIQKKDAKEMDFDTIFWCSIFFSIFMYIVLFLCAPLIAKLFKQPLLVSIVRVFAAKIPLSSLNTIQHAYVSRNLQFKKFFFSTLGGTIISGVVGIMLAIKGFGVWAIVAQYLINSLIDSAVLLFTVKWHPRFSFSLKSVRELLGFSVKMTTASLINTVFVEMQSLLIGARYTSDELAFYKRGQQFPSLFINNICIALGKVMYPTLSNESSENDNVKRLMRNSLKFTIFFISPVMFGLISIAKPLVCVLLTDKWLPCVPFLQIACIQYLLQPVQTANCNAIKALGRADIYLWMEIVKKGVGVSLLLCASSKGVLHIAIACTISILFSVFVSCVPNIKLLNYSLREQISDIILPIISGIIMCVVVSLFQLIKIPNALLIVLQIFVGIIIYLGVSYAFRSEVLFECVGVIKKRKQVMNQTFADVQTQNKDR